MGTIIAGIVVIGIIYLAVRSMVRDTKNGKSIQCGGDCKHCQGHCHSAEADAQVRQSGRGAQV